MKKNIIALAIASVVAAPVAMAGAPTIYGQVSMAVDNYDMKDSAGNTVKQNSGTQVNSRTSKFGIKGSEDLGEGLTAVYKFEFEVQIDSATTLKNRNQYVGVAGGFGTVLLGRHDTPLKMAQGTDLFNYSPVADIKKQAGGLGVLSLGGELRSSNVLAYVSPSFSGVTLVGAFIPKETGGDATKESSLGDVTSFASMYGSKKEGLYLSGAINSFSEAFLGGADSANEMRLVAQYSTGGLVANVMYQDFGGKALEDTVQEGSTIGGAVAYKVGKFTPRLQIMQLDRQNSEANVKAEDSFNYALGLDYSLGKKTTVFAEYAMLENVGGIKDTKAETTALSIGLTHKF
ncbi:MAG: porin [Thiomicrorhabdus sp.]|nr:porin [Thiomicrorhabdus sp.]